MSPTRASKANTLAVHRLWMPLDIRTVLMPVSETGPVGVMSPLAAPTNNWLATDSIANESTLVRRQAVSKIRLRMAEVSKIVCE